jgi:hypothetical protein
MWLLSNISYPEKNKEAFPGSIDVFFLSFSWFTEAKVLDGQKVLQGRYLFLPNFYF